MKQFISQKQYYLKILFVITFILLISSSYGQYGRFEPGGYIGISGGLASPSSDLAMKSFERINSGYALNGMNFNVSFAYKLFKEKYGISSILSYASLPVDIDAFQNDISNIDSLNHETLRSDKNEIMIASLMAGAYAQFRLVRKTYLNLRLMVGPSYITFPGYTANHVNGTLVNVKDGYEKVAISYDFGICFKYMLTTSLYLLGDIDFFSSKVEIDKLYSMTPAGGSINDNFNQKVNSNNVTVGIGFFLDK